MHKNVVFFEKLLNEKILKTSFSIKKKIIFIFVARHPLRFKRELDDKNSFSHLSLKIVFFSIKVGCMVMHACQIGPIRHRTSFPRIALPGLRQNKGGMLFEAGNLFALISPHTGMCGWWDYILLFRSLVMKLVVARQL